MLKYNVGDVVKIKKRPKRWSYKIGWTKKMDDALPKSRNVRISILSYAYLPHQEEFGVLTTLLFPVA
jgi:hypothetical protein